MQTGLHEALCTRVDLQHAQAMIRACVHCGFCNATCPTYQLLGDELDGPRGRIYLMKDMLEENRLSRAGLRHLDRCLSCRSCETTCPSGVTYGRLLDIGRAHAGTLAARPLHQRAARWLIRHIVPWPRRLAPLLALARALRWALPSALARQVPARQVVERTFVAHHARKVLLLEGCVQAVATPTTTAALGRLLAQLGIASAGVEGCCGALDEHLADAARARAHMRRLIDACGAALEGGAEAVLSSASGCGVHLKDYGELLKDDPVYAERARRLAELVRDPAEFLEGELARFEGRAAGLRVAWHSPCSLQHGQGLGEVVEGILRGLGVTLTATPEAHLCCGSAGSYSLLHPLLADRLRTRKLGHLTSDAPTMILTANVGCQLYLGSGTNLPVLHWVEFVEQLCREGALRSATSAADPSVRAVDWPPARR